MFYLFFFALLTVKLATCKLTGYPEKLAFKFLSLPSTIGNEMYVMIFGLGGRLQNILILSNNKDLRLFEF